MTDLSDNSPDTASSYDDVPYDSQPFAHTHPDQMAVMAAVFGLDAPPVDSCRILELGCASGGNLLPMAAGLPGADCLGVDLSRRQIDEGRAVLAEAQLDNVRLDCRSIMDVTEADGRFDYIICHGVFSWVPADVRRRILEIASRQLTPGGVAYVSYNTLPGWHLRGAIREMMQFHAGRFENTSERVGQARALLDFLAESSPAVDGAFGRMLADEVEIVRERADSYVFHEHLEEINEPMYFHRFVEEAERHELRFLSEATLGEMVPNQLADPAIETLSRIAPDLIHMEQYTDFLRNRMFRRSLLCHQRQVPQRHLEPDRIVDMYAAAPLRPSGEVDEEGEHVYAHPHGSTVRVSDPLHRAALEILNEAWPGRLPVRELAHQARDRAGSDVPDALALGLVAKLVLDCFAADIAELRLDEQRYVTRPGARPSSTRLARVQAATGPVVTNLRHETVTMVDISRSTLRLLDGSRDREQLVRDITERVLAGELSLEHEGVAVTDRERIARLAAATLDEVLDDLARRALLTA